MSVSESSATKKGIIIMHYPETVEALSEAKLKSCVVENADCDMYEISFPDGAIPEELKLAAQQSDKAKEMGVSFVNVPDEHIIPHLKVYNEEDAEIALTVTMPDKGALYTLYVQLQPAEKFLFNEELKRANDENTKDAKQHVSERD